MKQCVNPIKCSAPNYHCGWSDDEPQGIKGWWVFPLVAISFLFWGGVIWWLI